MKQIIVGCVVRLTAIFVMFLRNYRAFYDILVCHHFIATYKHFSWMFTVFTFAIKNVKELFINFNICDNTNP